MCLCVREKERGRKREREAVREYKLKVTRPHEKYVIMRPLEKILFLKFFLYSSLK